MKKASLVFIPSPSAGRLGSAFGSGDGKITGQSRPPNFSRSSHLQIPQRHQTHQIHRFTLCFLKFQQNPFHSSPNYTRYPRRFLVSLVESQKPNVREVVTKLVNSESFPPLAGFVLDMFCLTMIDVANEFSVHSYLFLTSSAACLGFLLHIGTHDEQNLDVTQFKDPDKILDCPTLMNPLPSKVFLSVVLTNEGLSFVLDLSKRFRQTKGTIVNTFLELETYAINSLDSNAIAKVPPVYPIGPILNLKENGDDPVSGEFEGIMKWLDKQPSLSVIFLCFGSVGSLSEEQVKVIASAIESTGCRFLWSLRKPPPKGQMEFPTDYVNPEEVLPEGFLARSAETGRIIGWAPQAAILGHPAIDGFVSHCGWNSTLESIWFGVPIAIWPLYAEQQFNAFEMVVELGLAVEIKMDYRKEFGEDTEIIVTAAEIERGIRSLMEADVEKRNKVKKVSEISRKALMEMVLLIFG